jgi:hypothetical protein
LLLGRTGSHGKKDLEDIMAFEGYTAGGEIPMPEESTALGHRKNIRMNKGFER